jgi:protein SSD1
LDDALSVTHNEDGTYDIGIHIADVSYFVKPNTALDRDAKKRATSVYLVQRAVPMLPPALSEELCSLVPGKDRLAFSVIFTMTSDAKVSKKWFGRTVIRQVSCLVDFRLTKVGFRSSAKLTYKHAQDAIDGKLLGDVPVSPEHDASAIQNDIKVLYDISKILRERRYQNGALSTTPLRLRFKLDEKGNPEDCLQYELTESNKLVEEVGSILSIIGHSSHVRFKFMLLSNIAVAEQTAVNFPEQALLRRHDTPIERRLVRTQSSIENRF